MALPQKMEVAFNQQTLRAMEKLTKALEKRNQIELSKMSRERVQRMEEDAAFREERELRDKLT